MSAICGTLGMDVTFGDYKACSSGVGLKEKVPDFALITETGEALSIGEAKTPWAHDLNEEITGEFSLRRCLGERTLRLRRSKHRGIELTKF